MRGGRPTPTAETSKLGEALQNVVVLADSKGDADRAQKILRGAVRRAPAEDPALHEALEFLEELEERRRNVWSTQGRRRFSCDTISLGRQFGL